MNFIEAMRCVREGNNVTRAAWNKRKTYVFMPDMTVRYQVEAIMPCSGIFVREEYKNATDWEIIDDLEIKTQDTFDWSLGLNKMNFSEALELLKQGKHLAREAWDDVYDPYAEWILAPSYIFLNSKGEIWAKGKYEEIDDDIYVPYESDILADDWEIAE